MIVNHNIPALNAYRNLTITQSSLSKSLERLSSGLRINRASDDAAGLAISEKMRTQINGLAQAIRNAQDGISLIQTAEGAMDEVHAILQRMRELANQAANDTYTAYDRQQIQKEIDQLKAEIDRIAETTQFNTKKLLTGELSYNITKVRGDATVINMSADSRVEAGKFQVAIYQAADVAKLVGGTAFDSSGNTSTVLHTGNIYINGVAVHFDSEEYNAASDKLQYIIDKINAVRAQTNVEARKVQNPYNSNVYHLQLVQLDVGTSNVIQLSGDDQTLKDLGFGLRMGGVGAKITTNVDDVLDLSGMGSVSGDLFINNIKVATIDPTGSYTIQNIVKLINDKASETGVVAEAVQVSIGSAGNAWQIRLIEATPGRGINLQYSSNSLLSALGFGSGTDVLSGAYDIIRRGGDSNERWLEGAENKGTRYFSGYPTPVPFLDGDRININGVWITLRDDSIGLRLDSLVSVAARINSYSDVTGVKAEVVATGRGSGASARLRLYQITPDPNNKIILYADVSQTNKKINMNTGDETASDSRALSNVGFDYISNNSLYGPILDSTVMGARSTTGVNVKVRVYSTDQFGNHIAIYHDKALIIEGQGYLVKLDKQKIGNNIYTPLNYDYTKRAIGLSLEVRGVNTPWATAKTFSYVDPSTGDTTDEVFLWGSAAEVRVKTDKNLFLHVGANEGETMRIDIDSLSTDGLGITELDVTTHEGAELALTKLSDAINKVSDQRAKLGAFQNRLEHTIKNLRVAQENTQAAESRIRDVDMAQEMMQFTKLQILLQSGTAMLAQANTVPQTVLQLLR